MKNFRTSSSYQSSEGFKNNLPSLTVPDQSLSLKQLLVNYTRGGSLPQTEKTPAFFDESAFIPNLKGMDLVDIQELMEANAKNAEILQNQYKILTTPLVIESNPITPPPTT